MVDASFRLCCQFVYSHYYLHGYKVTRQPLFSCFSFTASLLFYLFFTQKEKKKSLNKGFKRRFAWLSMKLKLYKAFHVNIHDPQPLPNRKTKNPTSRLLFNIFSRCDLPEKGKKKKKKILRRLRPSHCQDLSPSLLYYLHIINSFKFEQLLNHKFLWGSL